MRAAAWRHENGSGWVVPQGLRFGDHSNKTPYLAASVARVSRSLLISRPIVLPSIDGWGAAR
jgi:hypothetical protein